MAQSILILLIGVASGFCSSAPLGPINMWIVELALKRASFVHRILPFLAGVIVADVTYACLALWGYDRYLHQAVPSQVVGIAGSCFLIGIGLLMLRSHFLGARFGGYGGLAARLLKNSNWQRSHGFVLGVLLCASNPALIVFWAFVVEEINRYLGLELTLQVSVMFAFGIILGDSCWFRSLIYLVTRGRDRIGGQVIDRVRFGIAFAFILIGLLGFWQHYF